MIVGLVVALLAVSSSLSPVTAQAPDPPVGGPIDDQDLVSEQALRSWQVRDLQPANQSTLSDWDVLVWDFAEINGVMYVGGRFQTVRRGSGATEHPQAYLAAFEVSTGQLLSSFRPQLDDGVYALAASADGSRLFVGGEFTSVNGVDGTSGLAALDPVTGEPDPNWQASVTRDGGDHLVMDIEVASDRIYVGGQFSKIEGDNGRAIRRYSLARLHLDGSVDLDFDVQANGGRVMAMGLSPDDQELYVGGFFTSLALTPETTWMAMVRTATAEVVPLADPIVPNRKRYVFDLIVTEDRVWAGTEGHRLYMWDRADRTLIQEFFTSGYGGDYQALYHHEGVVWVGGHHHGWERDVPTTWYRQVNWLSAYDAQTADPIDGWIARMGARDGIFAIIVDSEGKVWAGGDPTSSGTVPVGGFAVYPPRSDDTEVNLARGGLASQSSDGTTGLNWRGQTTERRCNVGGAVLVGPASAAVDGKIAGGPWECSLSSTRPEIAPWWQVDLGATGEVDALRIWNLYSVADKDDLADVWIAVSDDPDAINSTDPVALAEDADVTLVQIPGILNWFHEIPVGAWGRYVRVFLNSAEPTQLRLPEVEVLDLPGISPRPRVDEDRELVAAGADWQYWDIGAPPDAAWQSPAFDAAAWQQGPALLGFGDDDITTTTESGSITTYVRHEFEVADPDAVPGLVLDLLADDGAVAWLNGTEIHRLRMPVGPIDDDTPASDTVWGAAERSWSTVTVPAASLVAGTNVLAVEVHNNWSGGSDLAFDAALTVIDEVVEPPPVDEILVALDGSWSYLDDGSDPGPDWMLPLFDANNWAVGPAQLGYGDGDEATVISEGPVPDRHITSYFRTSFEVADPAVFDQVMVSLIRDDGAIVYLNGTEVVRSNVPDGPVDATTRATDYAWGSGETNPHVFSLDANILVPGPNTIAVEIHSADPGSRDLSFALELVGMVP